MTDDLDEKAKRLRTLLSSFYGDEGSQPATPKRRDTLAGINMPDFDSDRYMASLLRRTPLDVLLQKHVEMAAEIKNLDSDMQMLVYENYNKFISATDTIRRMKENVSGMESNMDQLLETVTDVRAKSDGINASLCERRERIEELNGTRSLLRKIQFIFYLPKRLRNCLKSEAYADAVKFYNGALPILKVGPVDVLSTLVCTLVKCHVKLFEILHKLYRASVAYGKTSFQSCKEESDHIIVNVTKKLQVRVMDSTTSLEVRAEAVSLLQQLDYPVEKLIEKFLGAHWDRLLAAVQMAPDRPGFVSQVKGWLRRSKSQGNTAEAEPGVSSPRKIMETLDKEFIGDFTQVATTYRALFPTQEDHLTEAAMKLFDEYFTSVQQSLQAESEDPSNQELTAVLKILSDDVSRMHELVPEAGLPERVAKAVENAVRQHVAMLFTGLYSRIIGTIMIEDVPSSNQIQNAEKPNYLQVALDQAKKVILFDSVEILRDLKDLLDGCGDLLVNWRDAYIDLVQASFQDLFTKLNDHFHSLCSRSAENQSHEQVILVKSQSAPPGLVLMLALLSVYIQQTAVPKITEVVGASFVGGGAMGYEARPALVPSEICRFFQASGEKFLHEYIDTQARKLSVLIRKSVETPNWLKNKEPRDVRMFGDLLLQEVEKLEGEVRQVLDRGTARMHRRTDSSGSAGSSRSNATSMVRDDRMSHRTSLTHRARSRLLERDVAKLFKQKIELFTKVEFTQASVVSTVVKLCLKTFHECVRLQTFSRSGYNQIQLDAHYLRDFLRDRFFDNETLVDSLLDEVCSAAAERCVDPIPLEAAILDKLIEAKRARTT